ncbi:GRP family sugar transporter [Draconibacterium halophilum]|uniref:Multidrug DMT transporter permease n=1 Tax=Draconibacterium halophilum TaxID=2706887 RepID=A0A6C0RF81_9BACT|nr:GRP family sugar transporter [Draconibacterium halophilum]QIA08335.1 multidrug DMT transporter permease [Draconibacterium halophilum]
MYIVDSYSLAVVFCIITMLGWGSWANTLKLTPSKWEFPLYYWDYSIGLVLTTLLFGFTFGSTGNEGRSFVTDLTQADISALSSAFIGGVVFNIANLLVVAATAIAGLSVAFPIAIGLALVIGVTVNYLAVPLGNPVILVIGIALVVAAIIVDAFAYRRLPQEKSGDQKKGIIISIIAGVLMGFFYRFVAASMTTEFANPVTGLLTPYSAMFVFSIGLFISNFVFNTWFMYKPVTGGKVSYTDYFKLGSPKLHLIGILGGLIWGAAMEFNLIASEHAGYAISYGLGQGATMISAAWGVFVWKEFAKAPKSTNKLLAAMFVLFILGLSLIVIARVN